MNNLLVDINFETNASYINFNNQSYAGDRKSSDEDITDEPLDTSKQCPTTATQECTKSVQDYNEAALANFKQDVRREYYKDLQDFD